MLSILVVEDDQHIRQLISKTLEKQGYQIYQAENGEKGWHIFLDTYIDLMITDIMMPITDGVNLVKKIRQINETVPIVMLTALESFKDKERAFVSGIDDYLVKPIDMNELVLRVKSQLKRHQMIHDHVFTYKSITLDYSKYTCQIQNNTIELTGKEFQLLFKLVASSGKIFTREQLMNEIWGYDTESYERTIDTHIKRLREKLSTEDIELITVRGLGYKAVLK